MKTDGPKVTLTLSCFDCKHESGESYRCQGDSGTDVRCAHPAVGGPSAPRRIGDTTWDTPAWCPVRDQALAEFLKKRAA